jgi:hypothetical protein
MLRGGFFSFVYLIVGAVVASQHNYLVGLNDVSHLVSAALAVVLWPLVLLDVNLHLRITTVG